jgi:hypothetical protein
LPAYCCKVKIIGALGRQKEAIRIAVSVLREMGDNFPKKPHRGHVALELVKTKRLVRKMNDRAFMSLPVQRDTLRVYGMKLMAEIVSRGQLCREKEFFAVACLRMVRLSIKYGLSAHSLYGVAKFGMILSIIGATDEAYRMGRLTMRLLDSLDDTEEIETKCISSVYGFLNHLRQPVKQGQHVLKSAYNRGMRNGDVEWALLAGSYVCLSAFCYGDNLLDLEDYLNELHAVTRNFKKLGFTMGLFLTTLQAMQNLLGDSDNPAILRGDAMNEFDELPAHATEGFPEWSRAFYELTVACYFDNWEYAEEAQEKILRYKLGGNYVRAFFTYPCAILFSGVMYFARYEETGKRLYRSRANKCIDRASKMVQEGTISFLPVLSVLLAEKACISGNDRVVQQEYDSAIVAAVEADMPNFAGVANERAASYFGKANIKLATAYLVDAKEQYIRYGSPVLVEKVEEKLAALHPEKRRSPT